MPVSYEVSSIFMLEDRASAVLGEIAGRFDALEASITRIQEQFAGFGNNSGLSSLQDQLGRTNSALTSLSESAARSASSMDAAFASSASGLSAVIGQVERLTGALAAAQAAASQVAAATAAASGGGGGGGFGGSPGFIRPRGGGGGSTQSYEGGGGTPGFLRPNVGFAGTGSGGGSPGFIRPNVSGFPEEMPAPGFIRPNVSMPEERPAPGFIRPNVTPIEAAVAGTRIGASGILHGTGQLIEAAGLYISYKDALGENQALYRAAEAFGVNPNSPEGQEVMAMMRKSAADAAIGTTFSQRQTAGAIPVFARPLMLQGVEGAAKFAGVFSGAVRSAEAIKMLGKGEIDDTLESAAEFAHMTRHYEPDQVVHDMNLLGAITQLTPHSTFGGEARVMSYAVPMARIGGIPADEAAIAVGFLQQSGFRGTVAGTTLRQMLVGLTRTGGPMNAQHRHLAHMGREFSRGLHLEAGVEEHLSERARSVHLQAMHDVGYLDAQNHPTFLDDHGNINLPSAFRRFHDYAAQHTAYEAEVAGYDLFGVRGMGAPEMVGANAEQYEKFAARVRNYTPLEQTRDQMSTSVPSELEQSFMRLRDIGNNLADSTFPGMKSALEGGVLPFLNRMAALSHPDDQGHYSAGQQAAGYAGVATIAAGALAGFGPTRRGIISAGQAIASAPFWARAAVGVGAAGVLLQHGDTPTGPEYQERAGSEWFGSDGPVAHWFERNIHPFFRGLKATPADASSSEDGISHWSSRMSRRHPWADDPYADESRGGIMAQNRIRRIIPEPYPDESRGGLVAMQRQRQQSGGGGTSITNNIGPITITGGGDDLKGMVERLFAAMAAKLAGAMTHSVGTGEGTGMSPFQGYP